MWEHLYTTSELEKTNRSVTSFELEGIAGFIYPQPAVAQVILFRSYNPDNGIHLLSAEQEYNYVLNFLDFVAEGQAGFIYPAPIAGTRRLWRLRNTDKGDYLYTIDAKEKQDAQTLYNYIDEGPIGYVYDAPSAVNTPLYRSYNPENNDHFYTTDFQEYQDTINKLNFRDEQIACYLPVGSPPSIVPLYRCHHKDRYDFLYTTKLDEVTNAINNLNYAWEGITGYVDTVPSANNVPFTRLVHRVNGDHFYTANAMDLANAVAVGYDVEGIACNIFTAQVKDSVPLYRLLHVYDAVVHANIIGVGGDTWEPWRWTKFRNSFAAAAVIYRAFGMRLELLGEFFVPHADGADYEDIGDDDEASDLTHDWSAVNFAIDVFGVKTYAGDTEGYSAIDGRCDKSYVCQLNGAVVELAAGDLGVVIAHEIGHYLGLTHDDRIGNLMNETTNASTILLSPGQALDIQDHCFVRKFNYQ